MARLGDQNKDALFGGKRGGDKKAEAKPGMSPAEIAKEMEQLGKDINELRSAYEMYFMGVEKKEPVIARDLVKSKMRKLGEIKVMNTSTRFLMQQLKARLVSLESHWGRILQQKENGTYRRDVAKVKRLVAERDAQTAPLEKPDDTDAMPALTNVGGQRAVKEGQTMDSGVLAQGQNDAKTAGRKPGRPGAADGDAMTRPVASSADDLTDARMRRLYQTYIGARKRTGEAVDLRYEEMVAALRKQVPKLMQSTGAKAVEFKVVIREGRAVLKALPKNDEK